MPTIQTRIADLVADEAYFRNEVNIHIDAKNELEQAGLFSGNSQVDAQLAMNDGPRHMSLRYVNPLTATEVNVASDDFDKKGKTGKFNAGTFRIARHHLNYGWVMTDLVSQITGMDVEGRVIGMTGQYWLKTEKRIIADTIKGVKAALGASIVTEVEGTILENAFDGAVQAAAKKNIDREAMNIVGVSRAGYADLQRTNKLASVRVADTPFSVNQLFGQFNTVILPDDLVANNEMLLLSQGQFTKAAAPGGYGRPFAIQRDESAGNGNGGETLWSRRNYFIHCNGLSYNADPLDGVYAAELSATMQDADSYSLIAGLTAADIGIEVVKFSTGA